MRYVDETVILANDKSIAKDNNKAGRRNEGI